MHGRKIICLRYLLNGSFIILGISGAIMCGTGSYLTHQLDVAEAKWYGPPVLVLTTGIVNTFLGSYFFYSFDTKYNRPQIIMFIALVGIVGIVEAGAGLWAILDHAKVDSSISQILEGNLASVGATELQRAWNVTEIKVKCCRYEDPMILESDEFNESNTISWSCCNPRRYDVDDGAKTCAVFYINECHHLVLHRYRSVLIDTFVAALCAIFIQVAELFCLDAYAKKALRRRRRLSVVVAGVNQPQTKVTCPVVQLGAQHVCEGCSVAQYEQH